MSWHDAQVVLCRPLEKVTVSNILLMSDNFKLLKYIGAFFCNRIISHIAIQETIEPKIQKNLSLITSIFPFLFFRYNQLHVLVVVIYVPFCFPSYLYSCCLCYNSLTSACFLLDWTPLCAKNITDISIQLTIFFTEFRKNSHTTYLTEICKSIEENILGMIKGGSLENNEIC